MAAFTTARTAALIIALAAAALAVPAATTAQRNAPVIDRPAREPAATSITNPLDGDFAHAQLRHPRVLEARVNARFGIKRLFRERGIAYPAEEVFMRVFKRERILELWVRPAGTDRFTLLKAYPVCALAGRIGPKRSQGDNQTPEGFYEIDAFNPDSEYLLSLHVNYPNASDRALGHRSNLGGAIFIHGGCRTIGCIAVTDDAIEELYWIAVEARSVGQNRIPVHIFPARLTNAELTVLERAFNAEPRLVDFWRNLQPGYLYFENNRRVPDVSVDHDGRYFIADPALDRPVQAANGSTRAPAR